MFTFVTSTARGLLGRLGSKVPRDQLTQSELASRVITLCDRQSQRVGRVARVALREPLAAGSKLFRTPSVSEIVAETGMRADEVRRALARITDVTATIERHTTIVRRR